jgi:hypothetical protein
MVEMIDGPLFLLCTYSLSLLLLQENGHDEICIKAMGRAINKTVMVVELIKVGWCCPSYNTAFKLLSTSVFNWHLTVHAEKGWRSSSEYCY